MPFQRFTASFLILLGCVFGAQASEEYLELMINVPDFEDSAIQAGVDAALERIDERAYPEAEMEFGKVIARLEKNGGADARTVAYLIANRGVLKAINAGATDALLDLDTAIERLEAVGGPFDRNLIDMLIARGLISRDVEAFEIAEESLRRAQHIAHRHDGVYTRDQLPIVRHLTNVHLAQGMVLNADREQRFNLRISEQTFGEDSEEIVPVLEQIGTYFANRGEALPVVPPITSKEFQSQAEAFTEQYRIGLFRESIDLFDRAIDIVENHHGPNDLRLVRILRGLAEARLMQRTAGRYAERAMERAVSIVDANPGTDVTDRARILVDLGDVYTITSDHRADETYLQAWNLLTGADDPALIEVRNELFGTPTRLFPDKIRAIALDRQPSSVEAGNPLYADVEFSVVENGRVSNVKIVDGNVPNEEMNMLRRHLRSAKFRPRIVNGEIVGTEGLMLHQTFEVIDPDPEFNASFETGP